MSEFLFVYGTLLSTENTEAARRLEVEGNLITSASTLGRIYDQGLWPGLILSPDRRDVVYGELWKLNSTASFKWLDIYEGIRPGERFPEYARKIVPVYPATGGAALRAWGYVYQWPVRECDRIPSGRWQDRPVVKARRESPLADEVPAARPAMSA